MFPITHGGSEGTYMTNMKIGARPSWEIQVNSYILPDISTFVTSTREFKELTTYFLVSVLVSSCGAGLSVHSSEVDHQRTRRKP